LLIIFHLAGHSLLEWSFSLAGSLAAEARPALTVVIRADEQEEEEDSLKKKKSRIEDTILQLACRQLVVSAGG